VRLRKRANFVPRSFGSDGIASPRRLSSLLARSLFVWEWYLRQGSNLRPFAEKQPVFRTGSE
jgi:hypothetical protein